MGKTNATIGTWFRAIVRIGKRAGWLALPGEGDALHGDAAPAKGSEGSGKQVEAKTLT